MRVAAVVDDLMLYSRIDAAASAAGASLVRVDDPSSILAADLDLVLVDWSARDASWTDALRALRDAGTRVVLFGRHTDLEAHAAARNAGLGPMWARSKLVTQLPALVVASA
jgi:DNA-binding response OmpR family regulator